MAADNKSGLVFDIKDFAVHDGPGIRTTVFLKGCPLDCWWCHNPESRNPKEESACKIEKIGDKSFPKEVTIGRQVTVTELIKHLESQRIFFDESGGGLTISGGEPLMQADFCKNLLLAAKTNGFHTCLDTTAYTSKSNMSTILPLVDLFLFDIKLVDDILHRKYTGQSNRLIMENLHLLIEHKREIRIRVPLIPDITDTTENLKDIASLAEKYSDSIQGIDLLPYHRMSKWKLDHFSPLDRPSIFESSVPKDMTYFRQIFRNTPISVNFSGQNLHHE